MAQSSMGYFIESLGKVHNNEICLFVTHVMGSGGGAGGGGGGGEGNLWVILVRVCDPVLQNLPHSYIWPSKRRTHSYT